MLRILTLVLFTLSTIQLFSYESSLIKEESLLPSQEENLDPDFPEMSEEEKEAAEAFFALDWKETGTHSLTRSNSTLSIPEGYRVLIGDEAKKGRNIVYEDLDHPDLEAVACDEYVDHIILFDHVEVGYVSLDDWQEIDPKALLESTTKNTEEANKERRKNGTGEIYVVGWMQEPVLNKNTHTVYWAIEAKTEEGHEIVNSIALKLGRKGYERINWVSPKASYVPQGGHLAVMTKSHHFDPGYQYSYYQTGDKLAGYGIAGLVAATVGGKLLKGTAIVLALKKFAGLAFAAIAAFFYKFKNYFKRNKEE